MVTGEPGEPGVNAARNVIKANTTERESVCIRKFLVPTKISNAQEAVTDMKISATSINPAKVSNEITGI